MTPYSIPVATTPFTPRLGPITLLGRCRKCKEGVRVQATIGAGSRDVRGFAPSLFQISDGALAYPVRGNIIHGMMALCPVCQAPFKLNYLVGRYVEFKPCGARCTGATGPNCECSCGGKNHGASHC